MRKTLISLLLIVSLACSIFPQSSDDWYKQAQDAKKDADKYKTLTVVALVVAGLSLVIGISAQTRQPITDTLIIKK
jgi:hypothetical protein